MREVDEMLVSAGPGMHFELDEAMIQGRKQLVWKNVSPPHLQADISNPATSGVSSCNASRCSATDLFSRPRQQTAK